MWSSLQEHNHHPRPLLASSSPSSSISFSSTSSSSVLPCSSRRRNMEEVWREIGITPSLDRASNATRGMILQDFLAGPTRKETAAPPPPLLQQQHSGAFPLLPPTTALSLSTALGFPSTQQPGSVGNISSSRRQHSFAPLPFMMGSSPPPPPPPAVGLFSFGSPTKLALLDNSSASDGGGFGDRRNKRMMKNRESAARSRARKQAYTNELELEVAHLLAENEKLRKQYQELSSVMAAQHSAKKTLQRTLTAPF